MPTPGEKISHYRILEEIGRGGMGIVYKARDDRLGRFVAVKFLTDEWEREEEALQRFRQEARAASSLNHPNICTVYDIDEYEGRPFIVMEFLEGATLERRLATSRIRMDHLLELGAPLPDVIPGDLLEAESGQQYAQLLHPTEVLRVGAQIADALDAAHSAGVIHRDIKPGNIFLTDRKQAKLLDFGLAKLAPRSLESTVGRDEVSAHLTGKGVRLGTVAYMSPEQLKGGEVGPGTDLFSLGIVLYEMTTQRHPFLGKSTGSTIANILKEEPRRLADFVPDVPARAQQIIGRCLRKPPEARYQSAADLARDLEGTAGFGPTATPLSHPETSLSLSRATARSLFIFIQIGYLALYTTALFYFEELGGVLETQFRIPSSLGLSGAVVLAMCGIAVRLYLSSAVGLDHPEIGANFRKLFPALLLFDGMWAASPLLVASEIGYGIALAGAAGLAYLPFSQRTLVRAAYRDGRD